MSRLRAAALAGVAATVLAALGPAPAGAVELVGYDGSNPFACKIQNVGSGTSFSDPRADPFCVEYDKTHQNVTELGVVDFLLNEPARTAAVKDKCFYFQTDHWYSSVIQSDQETAIYNWDGSYYYDKARGMGGAFVKNFEINNSSANPTAMPGFPPEWKPYFGYGRGGVQATDSVPVDPNCVAYARTHKVYALHGQRTRSGPAAMPRLKLRLAYRHGRRHGAACTRSAVRLSITGADARAIASVHYRVRRWRSLSRRFPFKAVVPLGAFRRRGPSQVIAVALMRDRRRATLLRRLVACAPLE